MASRKKKRTKTVRLINVADRFRRVEVLLVAANGDKARFTITKPTRFGLDARRDMLEGAPSGGVRTYKYTGTGSIALSAEGVWGPTKAGRHG